MKSLFGKQFKPDDTVKKIIVSWMGFGIVMLLSFLSCGFLIYLLSKADYSFNRLIVSRHASLIPFSNINAPFPEVLSKEEFLSEVRYLGNLKEEFDLLEEGILGKIFSAFQLHPWVYKVLDVQREGPKNLKVMLEFRNPVLVVPISHPIDQIEASENFRVVDSNGVILPKNAPQLGLPVLARPLPFPSGKAGVQWKNDQVILCAKILDYCSGIALPKDCLIDLKDGNVFIYSEKDFFKIVWSPLSKDEQLSNQELGERKSVLKSRYSSWIQSGMKNSFIMDFSVEFQK